VSLGRKRPNGLGLVGQVSQSPPNLPGLDPTVKKISWAPVRLRWARALLEAHYHLVRSNHSRINAGHDTRTHPSAKHTTRREGRFSGARGTTRRNVHGMAARHGVALSPMKHRHKASVHAWNARHRDMGLLQCDASTEAAGFDGRSWGNDDEPARGGSIARSQAGTRKENDARGKGATVLTAGRWCSRRRFDEDGGTV
jgi:hypothetical protein